MTSSSQQRLSTAEMVAKDRAGRSYRVCISACHIPLIENCTEAIDLLHPNEVEYFSSLQYERRQRSYLLGRYSAKRAAAVLIGEDRPDKIMIDRGIFTQPIVVHANHSNIQVSISHCDNVGISIGFPEAMPMGIDIERIDNRKIETLAAQMTALEQEAVRWLPYSASVKLMLLWTAKEALSKILKTGLIINFRFLEIDHFEIKDGLIYSCFEGFPQFCTLSYIVGDYVCSITYPKRALFANETLHGLRQNLIQVISDT